MPPPSPTIAMARSEHTSKFDTLSIPLVTVRGKVLSMSHIFRIEECPLFLIDFETEEIIRHVLVRRQKQFVWHDQIKLGCHYSISNLKQDSLYKNVHDISVLIATQHSKLILESTETIPIDSCLDYEELPQFLTYQGTITSIKNEERGIYELNGNVILILSYLKDLVVGFDSSSESSLPSSYIKEGEEKNGTARDTGSLRVRDEVTVFNVHALRGQDSIVTLICCGRSLIKISSRTNTTFSIDFVRSKDCVIDCLHRFNFGIQFFHWLCRIEEILINISGCKIQPSKKLRRDGKINILETLLKKLCKLGMLQQNSRSLVLEYLSNCHSCAVVQEFNEMLVPTLIADLFSNSSDLYRSNLEQVDVSSPWNYSKLCRKNHNWIIFGHLRLTNGSCLQLESDQECITITVVGSKKELFKKIGNVVAIYNFDYIEEYFDIYGLDDVTKRYIMVESVNIICLTSNEFVSNPASSSHFKLDLLTKSGLNFCLPNSKKSEALKGFFVCFASVSQKKENTADVDESWNTLVCFRDYFAWIYPCLSERCTIIGKIDSRNVTPSQFRKSQNFSWLRPMYSHFGTNECIEMPPEFVIENIIASECKTDFCSISDVLKKDFKKSEYLTVEGWIQQRMLMTPKFSSQVMNLSPLILNKQVGIPGSKLLRVLLQDSKNLESSIWIYLPACSQLNVHQYYLGLIPEVNVQISYLQRKVSVKNSIYLSSTVFTAVNILSTSHKNSKEKNSIAEHRFIAELNHLPSGSVCTIFATIICILNVTLKIECPACHSEYMFGKCNYVGCHSNEPGIVVGSAKFLVEDGTEAATVYTKDIEHIKILSSANDLQWNAIEKLVAKQNLLGTSKGTKDPSFNENDVTTQAFISFLKSSENFRTVKIKCRTFSKESYCSILNLFALCIADLYHDCDVLQLKIR